MVVDRFRRRLTGFRTVVLGGLALFAGLAWALFTLAPGWAEEIGFAELRIEGTTLRVDPLSHTVDLDMPTVINTHLDGYDPELGTLPPDLRVVGDFSGPEIDGVLLLETVPNEPFRIPALRVGGDYELANIRLVQGDQVLAYAEDDLASILVTQILLTSVSSRALTDDEIRSYGLVLDGENYQALNLTFAFNVAGRTVEYNMPVVYDLYGPNVRFRGLPSVQLPMFGGSGNTVRDYRFTPPRLVPFSVKLPESEREEVPTGGCDPSNGSCRDRLPPEFSMVGMILFPTEISLLHQYFSVVLSVQNGAPEGDLLVVRDLMAKINLPSGLRLGETEPPTLLGTPTPVRTADGDHRIEGQEQGDAEYLIEGTEAGTYVVRFDMEGFLEGLPGGVQRITGEAKGAVMVHDPYLSVRVAHPQTVREDIGYMVYFTVTNLGNAPVNNISIALPPAALSGVEILPEGGEVHYTKEIGSLLPGDSEVVGFPIQSKLTGRIISTAVNTGSSTKPEFQWSLQVGVAGALSGDSLSVPTSSDNLPSEILRPALALAGLGYSLAKAPSTVDSTLPRLSMAEVNERIYRLSEAGRNRELGEELFDALAILACELNGARDHGWNFDQLRREHQKGEELAAAVAAQLSSLVTSPEEAFERFAATTHFLGPQAVLAVGDGVTVEVASRISGKAVAGSGPERVRDLPFAELYDLAGDGIEDAEMVVLLNEQETGGYQVRLGHATGGLADLHLMVPDVAGELRMVRWTGVDLAAAAEAVVEFQREDEDFILAVDDEGDGLADFHLAGDVEYPAPRPFQAIVAVQDAVVDPSGHVIEVLFSEDVDLASLLHDNQRDPNHFVLPGNVSNGGLIQSEADILGSLLLGEPDIENRLAGFSNPRIVQVVFDNPVSPLVEQPHQLTISHLTSAGGRALGSEPQTVEVVTTATELAIAVEGTVIGPDGNPVPNAQVALRESDLIGTGGNKECLRHTTAATTTDADGRYRFDYVRQPGCDDLFEVKAQVPEPSAFWGTATGRVRIIEAEPLQLNVVMPGRGSLRGQVRYQDGTVPDEIHVVASNRNRNEGRLAHVDDNGFYDVDDIVVGTVTLAAYDAERNFVYRTVELPEAGAEVEQDLIIVRRDPSEPPPGQLHGTVLLAEGEDPELYPPAVDAYVALYVNDELIAVERSDLDGRFDFGLVPTGIAEIEAFSASSRLSGARLFVEIEPDHTTDQEIILKDDRGVVRGCVRRRFWQHGTEDEKVVGAVVWAHGTPFHATTDEDGCFELEDVFAGTWKIHAVDLKHNEATSAKATLTSGGEVDTMLYFDDALPQGGILGRVLSYDDTPVRGATIHLAGGYMSTNWHHDTSTDDGGYFKIEDLSAGVHGVHAMGGTAGEPGVAVGGGGIGWANIRFPGATAYAEVKYRKGTIRVCTVQLQDNDTEVPVVSQIAYRTVEVVANWGVVALAEKFTHSSTDPDDGEVIDGCLDIEALIGPYQIYVYNGSLGTRRVTGELTADGEPPFHKIEFEPTSTIRGVLYDYDGETPVVDATVSLSGGNYAEGGYEIDTDEEGGFAFPMLEKATSYRIDVSHSDGVIRRRLRTGVHVRSAGEVVDIELVLPEQGSVTGQVVRETGVVGDDDVMETEGVPGAVVSMYEVAYPHRRFVQNADNDGYFAFDNIAAGEVTVRAVVPELGGLGGHDRGKIECEAHELILEVVIEPVGEVFGKVINPDDGDPVPNAQVWIVRSGIVDAATSDENGEYRFHFLPVGNYQIRVYDPNTGRNGSSTWFLVGPFQVVQEDTELQVRGNVEGTFFDQSKNEAGDDVLTAIPGSVIRLIPSGWYHATYCSTDHLGGYLFEGIPEGEFDLFAHEDDGRRTASASGEIVAEDETVTVDLVLAATGSVTGVVLNPPGMEPGPFENVNVRVVQGGQVIGASLGSSFEFDGLIAGRRFQLIANEIASLRQAQAYGKIDEVGGEASVNLTMQAMGSVTVKVTDNDNVDVDEPADVVVYNRHDYGREHFYGSTGGDPEVSFADIREGSLWTRATDPQGLQGSTSGELMEEGETVVLTVKLEDTGTIRGRAVLADGVNPAAFATVALNLQGDWYMTEADEGGNFELESIPMGSYRLIVQEHEGSALIERLGTLTSNGQVDEYGDLLLDGADPYVVSITPPSGTRELDPNTTITIQFSELIDASRSAPAVALRERSGWGTPFQLQWTETEIGSAVTIIPTDTDGDGEALKSGTGYDVDILDGIYDVAGRNMAWRVRSTFYVRDYIPPTVIHMVPADMANQVPVGTAIRVTFSEPVQVVSLSDEAFQLFDLTLNQPVSTQPAFLLDDDPLLTREAIFTHGNLENDHQYQITVKDVLDEGGLSMEESEPVVTTFWTPDETDPSVTWESPEEGADFTAGDNVLMEVVASDDRGLEEVTFTIGEWSTTVVAGSDLASHVYVDSGTFSAQLPAPIMAAAGELQLTARAVDVFGNDFTATRTIQVAPLDNPKSPEIVSPCPVHEDLVAPGLEIPIPYAISDDHKIESYRVEVNGEILDEWTPVNEPSVEGTYLWTPPADAVAGQEFQVKIRARDFADNDGTHAITLVVPDTVLLTGDQTVDGTDAGQSLALAAGTFTMSEPLALNELVILHAGELLSAAPEMKFDVTGVMKVQCGGLVDATGAGYAGGTSAHPDGYGPDGLQPSTPDAGGSHGGVGQLQGAASQAGEIFDSVYQPSLGGGGGASVGSYYDSGAGGGVLVIDAHEVVVDGQIAARGKKKKASGAGGSILITTGVLRGDGMIDVSGGEPGWVFIDSSYKDQTAGGGGRIAIRATDLSGFDVTVQALARGGNTAAGPGTVYAFTEGTSTCGRLVIDGGDDVTVALPITELPELGSGTLTGTLTGTAEEEGHLWVTGTAAFPVRWRGAWMRLLDENGASLGSFRVIDRDPAGQQLLLRDAAAAAAVAYQGEYCFDEVVLGAGVRLSTSDPTSETAYVFQGDNEIDGEITATDILVKGGAHIRPLTGGELRLLASGTITIEEEAVIEVNGLGYPGGTDTHPDGYGPDGLQPSAPVAGGSHGGAGELKGDGPVGEHYGSVYQPMLGGGGGAYAGGTGNGAGGGVLVIAAQQVVLDGALEARGLTGLASGAGGSILIAANVLEGGGMIDASGGESGCLFIESCKPQAAGGGGRIGIHVTESYPFDLTGDALAQGGGVLAEPGTVYTFLPGSTYGDLRIDGDDAGDLHSVKLPVLGSGTILATEVDEVDDRDLWVTGSSELRVRWLGAWMELLDGDGNSVGTYEVIDRDAGGRLLLEDAETAAATAASYRGEYRFDEITLLNAGLQATDPVREARWILGGEGDIAMPGEIAATEVVIGAGITVRPQSGGELRFQIDGAMTIEQGARLDVSGLGFSDGNVPELVEGAQWDAGGSHGGSGLNRYVPEATLGEIYDSVLWPSLPGAGSAVQSDVGNPGGGLVALDVGSLDLDGEILARGVQGDDKPGGAGGSVLITADTMSGVGSIDVSGGDTEYVWDFNATIYLGAGGGGRIAIHAKTDLSDDFDVANVANRINAQGGKNYPSSSGSGTLFVHGPDSIHGDLVVDYDRENLFPVPTVLPSIGQGIVGVVTPDSMDETDLWIEPQDPATRFSLGVVGMWVRINGGEYLVIGERDRRGILLEDAADAADPIDVGDDYLGLYKFDSVSVLNGATLEFRDAAEVATWNVDADSEVIHYDWQAPVVTIVEPAEGASFASGAPIAVSAEATDNTAVVEVRFELAGRSFVDTEAPYAWDVPAPAVAVPSDLVLTVEAVDDEGNRGSATRTLPVEPIEADASPVVTVACGQDAVVAPGTAIEIRIDASSPDAIGIDRVELYLGAATEPMGVAFDPPYVFSLSALETATAGELMSLRAVAVNFAARTEEVPIEVLVVDGQRIAADTYLAADDLSLEGATVVVADSRLTVAGTHHFGNLFVLSGVVEGVAEQSVDLQVDGTLRIHCGAQVDVSGQGYPGVAYGASAPEPSLEAAGDAGGSYGGVGLDGYADLPPGEVFDSVSWPSLGGGSGASSMNKPAGAGGGTVKLDAGTVIVDGEILANGGDAVDWQSGGGAGGAVVIEADVLKGGGRIEASGGISYLVSDYDSGAGGGGRVALHVDELTGFDPQTQVEVYGGTRYDWNDMAVLAHAGPGTIYVSTPALPNGELIIDGGTTETRPATPLPVLGSGAVTAITTPENNQAWVSSTEAFRPRWRGAFMVLHNASGTKLGACQVIDLDAQGRVLLDAVPSNVNDAVAFNGEYRFDALKVRGGAGLEAEDPVRAGNVTLADQARLPSYLEADNLTVEAESTVRSRAGGDLVLTVSGTLTIENNAKLDVSGQGWPGVAYGASAPEGIPGPAGDAGGSYGGVGLHGYNDLPPGEVFDSVSWPALGGGSGASGINKPAGSGGGTVKLDAGTVIVDGEILANGGDAVDWQLGGGAGGAVVIEADVLKGIGRIVASGGLSYLSQYYDAGAGGGGRVALHVDDLTEFNPATQVEVSGGIRYDYANGMAVLAHAGPGTIYISTPTWPNGELIIDGGTTETRPATPLPVLGSGEVTAITALDDGSGDAWVSSTEAFRPRWLGAWMVLHKASVNEMWEPFLVKDLDDQGRVRLAGAAIAAGDTAAYHGEHHFDLITLRGGGSLDAEDPVRAGEVHLYDQATLPTYLDADHLTVHANSTVRSAGTGELHLTVSGTLTVEGEAALDVSGQGYPGGPLGGQAPEWLGPQDEVAAGKFAGGSHGGVGLAGKYGFVKEPGEPYDSVYQPFLGGGSGGGYNGDHQGGDGGGVLFLEVGTLELQGAILANGIGHGTYANGGGAGGTIVIAATAISGAGRIEASGGSSRLFSDGNYGGAGGGGRVTIDAGQLNPAIRIEVRGGIRYQTQGEVDVPVAVAAPGTLLVTGLAAPNGDLFVDQGAPAGLSTPHVTLPAIGRGVIGAIEIEENPDNPGKLWIEPQDPETTFSVGVTGMWVRIGGYDYRVVAESQDRRHLLLDGATTDEVSVGDAFRGVYYFNVVTVSGGTTVEFHDFVEADSVVTDADSEVIFLDQTPPVIDAITPAAGAAFYSCDAIDISVEASDNIGVSEVRFEFAGQSFSDPEAPFEWSATAPEVTESADFALSVTALDAEGNQAIATRTIRVEFVCTYAIDPIGESFPAAGGTGTVTVTTPTGCDWTAGTADSWIRITAGSSGTGPGTVDYQVTANPSTESRAGTLSVAGQTVTVTQAGLATFLLSVVTDGSGAGTVTSSPAGVDCGVDCGESFTEGTLVSLTAAPAADAGFAGWSGACSGSESCTVTMTAPLAVTATFSQLCTNPWTGNGPDYAYVETLALVGSTLYAGTTNAIFESTDGGANWGMNRSGRTYSLTSDPTDPSLLYAGSNSEVLRSIDGGVTWSSAIVSGKVKALAVDPADTATVYAGVRGSGVLKSSDYGATWQPVSSGFTNLKLTSLAIDPNASSTLYAGTEQGGIFKTVDAGGSWTAVNTGLSSSNVRALAIDPLVPANLFAAAADGVYRSADAAVSWELVLSGNMTSLSVTVGSPLSVYAGDQSGDAWKSSDGGTTWELVADLENVGSIYGIAIDSSAAAVYLGTSWSGVIKSVDDVTWNEVNHGLNGGRTTALAIDPATPAIVYVANREGRIYKTIDGGAHWSRADAGLPGFWVTDVVVDPTDPSTVYASNAVGVYKSVDGGGLWTHATTDGLVGEAVSRLAIDPAGSLYAAASFAGVYRTTDGGGSWQANNTGLTVLATQAIAIDPGNPSVLYVSTYPEGLFKSEDAGQTWTAVGNGLPDYQISDLMVDSVNGSNVYAGIYNHGVYKSTDGGVNWSLTGMGPLFDYTFAIHPTEPRTLYASTRPYGIQQSVDGGATWYPRNEGRSLIRPVAMAIAPQEPYTVFVSTKGRSVQQLTECAAP